LIRVLLVIGQLKLGGAEVQLVRLARRLRGFAIHVEVAIFHPGQEHDPEPDLEPDLVDVGIRVHHVRRTSKVGLEAVFDLKRILREGRHDVVHSFLWPANWRARIAGRLAGTPVVISSPRSVETHLKLHHIIVDRVLSRWTDAIVVNAAAIRDFLIKREGLPEALFHVIYNGLDEAIFSQFPDRAEARARLGLAARSPMVLIVGNLQPEKNHRDFVKMAARVRTHLPETRFFMVGDGECRAALQILARELCVEDSIHWEGRTRNVLPYLAASDVVVNVSLREGCSNAILEAMAARKPVVAYAVGGNKELVDDGRTGRLLEFGDVPGLAEQVVCYLEDPELARKDGTAGFQRAKDCFRASTTAERTASLYRKLLGRKGFDYRQPS